MNKSVFIVTAGALALALIGLVYYAVVQPMSCTGSNHCIAVWVQTDGGKPTIHVSAMELHKHGQNHVIFWDIDNTSTPPYKFPDKGIAFMAGDGGTSEFDCDKRSDTRFRCKDPTGKIGKYKYTVTVEGTPQPDALPVNPLDPWIYNE
jgi:hypothetical protein